MDSFCSLREKFDADSRVALTSAESIPDFSSACSSPARSLRTCRMLGELMAVVGMANETNRLANGYQVEVDAQFMTR
jgi:hypothetical protein